jgi:hypothetical protein
MLQLFLTKKKINYFLSAFFRFGFHASSPRPNHSSFKEQKKEKKRKRKERKNEIPEIPEIPPGK